MWKDFLYSYSKLRPLYVLMLVLATLFGIATHIFFRKRYKNFRKATVIIVVGSVIGFALSAAVNNFSNYLCKAAAESIDGYASSNFSFLYSSVMIFLSVFIVSKIMNYDFDDIKEPFAASIFGFLFVGKIGCLINGCCASRELGGVVLHLNLYESIFAAAVVILYYFNKVKPFELFFFAYLPYRFISEFIRETYLFQIIFWKITAAQAFVVLTLMIYVFIKTAFRKA